MAEPKEGFLQSARSGRFLRMLLAVTIALAVVCTACGLVTGLNAFGRNISGTVTCANGDVMGVLVEAERLPRVWGIEMQSGFADWGQMSSSQSAVFNYWLPYGGDYTLHVGCGVLQRPGAMRDWATNNHTPLIRTTVTNWFCDNPVNTAQFTVTTTACLPRN